MIEGYPSVWNGVFICGDFNFVMNPEVDHINSTQNNEHSWNVMVDYMERASLCDVWRDLNLDKCHYTWHQWSNHHPQGSRIDLMLVSQWMSDTMQKWEISPGYLTDHSLLTLEMGTDDFL